MQCLRIKQDSDYLALGSDFPQIIQICDVPDCPAKFSGLLLQLDADHGARRLSNDGVRIRPQPAQGLAHMAAADHNEIGVVL